MSCTNLLFDILGLIIGLAEDGEGGFVLETTPSSFSHTKEFLYPNNNGNGTQTFYNKINNRNIDLIHRE